uniref:Uncharacterized protein n=1 Tax=Zea mays TaxID=4577 RepID=A0A804P7H3_MAIZE
MASDKLPKLTLSSPAAPTKTTPLLPRRLRQHRRACAGPCATSPSSTSYRIRSYGASISQLLVPRALGLGRGVFYEAFDTAIEISFARMLHLTAVVWNATRLAGIGSERRLREAIRIVGGEATVLADIVVIFVLAEKDSTSSAL